MGQLFDKPMSELREAFVRARFAEPNMFGRSDIEEWFRSQSFSVNDPESDDSPANAPAFIRYLCLLNREETWCADQIRGTVTEANHIPDYLMGEETASMLEILLRGGAELYFPAFDEDYRHGGDNNPIVVINDIGYSVELSGLMYALRRANPEDVIRVILGELNNTRPLSHEAYKWLGENYPAAIQLVRKAAQHDFDEAVAVSADGTKIVKAKWVLVGSDDESWRNRAILYPAEAFRTRKILIHGRQTRQGINMSHVGWVDLKLKGGDLVVNLLQLLFSSVRGKRNLWNQYLEDETGRDLFGSLYFTNSRLCPSPLPDGGREIQV